LGSKEAAIANIEEVRKWFDQNIFEWGFALRMSSLISGTRDIQREHFDLIYRSRSIYLFEVML
jgi:hypothetical protein